MLKAIEEIIANAQGHGVGHPETFEEIKVEFFFLLALIVIVGVSLVDLYLVGQWLHDVAFAHAVRAEKRGFGKFPLLLAERNHTIQ